MPIEGGPLERFVALEDLLTAGLSLHPDADAVVSTQQRWTFRELDDASSRLCAGYHGLGLKSGDRIASLMPNRAVLLIHYLACMKGGFVAVPLNYRYTHFEIQHALKKSETSFILFHDERRADVDKALEDHSGVQPICYEAGGGTDEPMLEDLMSTQATVEVCPAQSPEAPAFLMFTSGSTGPAKGVTHSRKSIAHCFASVAAGFEMDETDIFLPASSISHIGGLIFSFAVLSAGGRAVVARDLTSDEVITLLRDEKPTILAILPAALFRLIRDGHATHDDFASLRVLRSGSDRVPIELVNEFFDLTGLVIDEGWGCSEIGLASLNPPSGRIIPGSAGRPLPGIAASVRSAEGSELEPGQDGVVWVKCESRMLGYWQDDASTQNVFNEDWFDTGDVMRADKDGYLYFCGRKKQIIVHDGSNIFPKEVEDALLDHAGVAVAAAIGVRDLVHGEIVCAYVVSLKDIAPSETELIEFARERIGYKAPEEIRFLTDMPLNPTGKIDRVTLIKMAAEAHKMSV
jgi:long-chain acyl-CoA synthetase